MRFSMIMRAMKVSWNIHYDFGEKYPSYVKIGMVDLETGEKFYKKSWRYTIISLRFRHGGEKITNLC